ncbi:hypothetical protein PEC18_10345 [Paucibacter sp. O1-1]|nr:hypothetical protein [Paucibacter sp. O1-1]MDA3826231.1 hypothetical protein [Paucibacter sp. O1-1]
MHLTVSPSEMCSYSPRITWEPTESRFEVQRQAVGRPGHLAPAGNSSISPGHHVGQGAVHAARCRRCTDTTVPWLLDVRRERQGPRCGS